MPNNNTIITGKEIIIGFAFGMAAIAVNMYLSAPLFGNVILNWGNSLVLLALLTQRFPTALLACLVNAVGLAAFAELPYAGLLAMIEFCVLAVLQYHRVYLLLSSIFFWLCIGMPLTWFAIHVFDLPSKPFGLIFTVKEALAGLACAALACMVYFTLPAKFIATRQQQKEHKLATNIFSLSAMTLILPTLVISLLLTYHSTNNSENQLIRNASSHAQNIARFTEKMIDDNKANLEQLASIISLVSDEQALSIINTARRGSAGFDNLKLVNTNDGPVNVSANTLTSAQRSYNSNDILLLSQSENLMGNNEGSLQFFVPITTVSKPTVLVGAITLTHLSGFYEKMQQALPDQLLVISNNQREIIYASKRLKLDYLTRFSPLTAPSLISNKVKVIKLNNSDYHINEQTNAYGWTVYVLNTPQTIIELFSAQISRLGISLLVTILLFLVIAHRLSQKMAMPLVNLIEQSSESPVSTFEPLIGANIESSSEIKAVATRLRKSHVLLRDFEQQLQLQVTEKTEELEQLNLILAAQAREDGLTQLLNRSGFDELANNAIKTSQRLHQPLSFAIVDIDKFKNINDTYGHPIGDECLKAFAALMQSHCKRETDIIGRYGGEEFVILMSGKDVISHHQLIQNIHVDTQYLEVNIDSLKHPIKFTVSIGVCSLMSDSVMSLAQIIQIADEELYKCKNNGRNQMSIVTIEATE